MANSSIRTFWRRLKGAVHPDDQQAFDLHTEHSFNLNFPPPAFIGDVDAAPIVVLTSNGGYTPGETEKEFPDERSCAEHSDYLRGQRVALPSLLSSYYLKGPLGKWILEGSAVLVNAVPYRSKQLSKEKDNQQAAKQLCSLDVHRRWLFDEVLPEAKAGKRFVLVHRNGWWKVPHDEYGDCVVFSDPAKAEPNRPTPNKRKLELAANWLDHHYRNLGPDCSRLTAIERNFSTGFAPKGIRLPKPVLAARRNGRMYSEGWFIWYCFGSDGSGEFLDLYAVNRMTSDHHLRLHEDGRVQGLPAMTDWYPTSSDPVETDRMRNEYFARNQAIDEMLRAKGFNLGDAWSNENPE